MSSVNALTAPSDTRPYGEGAVVVSGVVITDVGFQLDPGNPAVLQAVELTLDRPAGGDVRLTLGSDAWHHCELAGTRAHCRTPGVPVVVVDQLRVVVA